MNRLVTLISNLFSRKNHNQYNDLLNSYINREITFTLKDVKLESGHLKNVRVACRIVLLSKIWINEYFGIRRPPLLIIDYSYRIPSPVHDGRFTRHKQGPYQIVIKGNKRKHSVLLNNNFESFDGDKRLTDLIMSVVKKDLRYRT